MRDDPKQNTRNIIGRQLSFDRAADFEWETVYIVANTTMYEGRRTTYSPCIGLGKMTGASLPHPCIGLHG